MPTEVGSQSLGIASELIVVMPIKKGFVETRSTISYATRIRLILKTLHAVRKVSVEANSIGAIAGPLERLQIIDVVRWSVLENETRLMMAVSFKGAWEPYIRKIQQQAGKILDAVLCNCDGYSAQHRSELGFPAFAEWVRKNQIRCEQYYSATPDITVDDLQYLRELATEQRNHGDRAGFDLNAARQIVKTPDDVAAPLAATEIAQYQRQWLQILQTFFGLDKYFPEPDGKFLRNLTRAVLGSPQSKYPLSAEQLETNKLPLAWISRSGDFVDIPKPAPQLPRNADDIQGGILNAYETKTPHGGMLPTHGVLLLLRFRGAQAGRAFLKSISGSITRHSAGTFTTAINIALTFEGLKRLGLPAQDLERLPREFRDGMEARAGLLGDVRNNHPRSWTLPQRLAANSSDKSQHVALSSVDCIVQLQTTIDADYRQDHEWSNAHPLFGAVTALTNAAAAANGGHEATELLSVQVQRRALRAGQHNASAGYGGHFGFVEGFSQPTYTGNESGLDGDKVPLGELLLGYPNTHGDTPADSELFFNSTFMVLRKLRQDVGAFDRFVAKASASAAISADQLKAKMMGRYPNGDPLLPAAGTNDFDYSQDRGGERCPLHAHIRRSNPRTAGTPRIIRRGFSYGYRYQDRPQDADRGLFFMAFNASIADQFEVIQQWLSGGNSTGLSSAESDPLMGVAEYGKPRTLRFIHNGNVERSDMNAPGPQTQFVTLEWGLYLFVPSIRALNYLATLPPVSINTTTPELEARAQETIAKLKLAEALRADPNFAPVAPDTAENWKSLLEDLSVRESGLTEAVWKVIREKYNGVLRTAYGVLLGNERDVMTVFRDRGKHYSVREYWQRMRQSIGEGFLGMDPQPTPLGKGASSDAQKADAEYRQHVTPGRYAQESRIANAEVAKISQAEAYVLARHAAVAVIAEIRKGREVAGKFQLPIEILCELTLAQLSRQWFGIPDGNFIKGGVKVSKDRYCPTDFVSVGSYVFNADPTTFVADFGKGIGQALNADIARYLDSIAGTKSPAPVLRALQQKISEPAQLARTLGGLIQGFVTPTFGSLISMMNVLIESKQLWHLQLDWHASKDKSFADAERLLSGTMIGAMRIQPVPGLLHRTCVTEHTVNGMTIKPGEKIVLGLVSATREKPSGSATELLFGGDYDAPAEKKTIHACPGKDMALGVMLGVLSVVLESGDLVSEGALMILCKGHP